MLGSAQAVSIGLIVTELVINAFKYAFPVDKPGALVQVTFQSDAADWTLMVSDNGVGKDEGSSPMGGGLGTVIVSALIKQLGAHLETADDGGHRVTIRRMGAPADLISAA